MVSATLVPQLSGIQTERCLVRGMHLLAKSCSRSINAKLELPKTSMKEPPKIGPVLGRMELMMGSR